MSYCNDLQHDWICWRTHDTLGGKKSPKITKALKLGLKNLSCSVLWELFFIYCAFSTVSGSPHHHGAEILTQYWKHCQGLSPVSPRLQFQGGQVLFSCMGCRTRDSYPPLELILFSSALNILQSQQVFGLILLNVENMWVLNLPCWALAFINKNLWFIHIAVQSVLTVFLFCTSDLYLWVMPEAFDKNIFCNIWELNPNELSGSPVNLSRKNRNFNNFLFASPIAKGDWRLSLT